MQKIMTGSWSAPLPPGHIKIGISRMAPRGQPAGYRLYKPLAPGKWFNSVSAAEYLKRYNVEILAPLQPKFVLEQLKIVAGDKVPVLCCFEKVEEIHAGKTWCHRHIAAQWLGDRLDVDVLELNAPEGFDPFKKLVNEGAERPSY